MSNFPDDRPQVRLRSCSLKAKLRSQGFVVGTFLQVCAPPLVELLGLAGFDFTVVDREHGAIGLQNTLDLIRAGLSTAMSVMVRVPNAEPTAISLPLDMGANGIHVPQIETAEMARQAVTASKYHPLGNRGLQPCVRAASYRAYDTSEYLKAANQDTMVVVQVEGKAGVSNLHSILNVEGIDIAFIGPYDLSQSLGIPGKVRDPRVHEVMVEAVRAARQAGKHIGAYCDDVETASEYRSMGVSYLVVGIDSDFFLSAARSTIARLK